MVQRTLLTAVLALFATGILGGAANAGHCPTDVKRVDAALKTSKVSSTQMTRAKALRNKGLAEHKAGRHGQSLNTLHEAMRILGVSH